MKSKVNPKLSETHRDSAFFLSAPEISVFVACCVMINELRGFERAFDNAELSRDAFQQKSKALLDRLAEAAESTQRFDVIFPVMEPGAFSPFFWRWFNWWNDYLKALTPSQVAETERRAREHGTLIEDLRPKGHWLNYRSTPPVQFQTYPVDRPRR